MALSYYCFGQKQFNSGTPRRRGKAMGGLYKVRRCAHRLYVCAPRAVPSHDCVLRTESTRYRSDGDAHGTHCSEHSASSSLLASYTLQQGSQYQRDVVRGCEAGTSPGSGVCGSWRSAPSVAPHDAQCSSAGRACFAQKTRPSRSGCAPGWECQLAVPQGDPSFLTPAQYTARVHCVVCHLQSGRPRRSGLASS